MEEELLTTKELANFLRLNEKKIYQLVRDSVIPHVKIAGKWLFPKRHVLRWIDENVQREKDILIVGSDDILMVRLLSFYSQENFPESQAFYSSVGSLRGIQSLSRMKGQACCTHILDVQTGEYNLPVLERILSPRKYVVVHLWHRKQGLIVKRGNPLGIRALEEIVEKGARFINRNEGSGTRVLLEYLMRGKGLGGKDILGFADEEDTHIGVAQKVFFGEADVGLGIEYVTHLLALDFIPLKEESFDLVIPEELWPTVTIKKFVSYLDPIRMSRFSKNLPGYNLKDTGKVLFRS
ncbi:MAG: helix-turn-helix transcriptional regulator [Deltaproteobacteria bacterium]|nr:helix-turn-helix transcriptional regulator [Deltaproteobacteria bacterium]